MSPLRLIFGRFFLFTTALALGGAGLFAIGLGIAGTFLPHDERYLGISAKQLCELHECRIVHFMIHDRISFGGALVVLGILYSWLVHDPLRRGERWAWWTFLVSGILGFASFFAYLGYGYLDTWHGLATMALAPCFCLGLALTYPHDSPPIDIAFTAQQPGRILLAIASVGIFFGGLVICTVGMSIVFVPQDIAYLGVSASEMDAINPRLVPLIAHDRAGFGGALACCGFTLLACTIFGRPTRQLWRVLAFSGGIGFGSAIFVHPAIGYNDAIHLAPAVVGAILFGCGLFLNMRSMPGEVWS